MKFKHIHFIINPASGKEEPVLSYINRAFTDSRIKWDISVTKKDLGAGDIARTLIGKTDLLVVYGGDGCVTDVAAALVGSDLPMAILPGGTANVMAREINVPLDTEEALALLQRGKLRPRAIDMGLVNGEPFLLRVNLGIMADMVISADRELKDNIGQLAYGVTAVQTMLTAKPLPYEIKIDGGQKIKLEGVALTVTNSGHMGVGDYALQPGISITDGLLDILVMQSNDWLSLLKVAGGALLQKESETLKHWTCRKVEIILPEKLSFICDDEVRHARKLKIEVLPAAINILAPVKK